MLMMLLKKFKFWYYRNRFDGMPSPEEIEFLGAWNDYCKMIRHTELNMSNKPKNPIAAKMPSSFKRYIEMAASYSKGDSLEDIAKRYNVTRERIRQCIMKYYREKTRAKS